MVNYNTFFYILHKIRKNAIILEELNLFIKRIDGMDCLDVFDRQNRIENDRTLALFSLLEQSQFGVLILSKNGRPIFCNAAAENLLDCKYEQLAIMYSAGIDQSGEPQIGLWLLRDLANTSKLNSSMERRYIRSDNAQIWIRITLAPAESNLQQSEYFIAILEDINTYKLIKQSIKSTSALPMNDEFSIIITDRNFYIEFWNQQAQNLYHWTSQEACGKDIVQLLCLPQNCNKCYRINRLVLANGYWEGEITAQTKNGRQIILRQIKTALKNCQGQADKIITVSFDITERFDLIANIQKNYQCLINLLSKQNSNFENADFRRQQEIIICKQAEHDLGNFYQISLDLFCIIDSDGRIQKCNTAFCRSLGYSEQQLIGNKINNYIHPLDRHRTVSTISKVISTGKGVTNFVNRCRCNDGTYLWLEWTVVPFMSEKTLYAVARNITARKQWESELARLDRLDLVGHMAASIGHELRNPLFPRQH